MNETSPLRPATPDEIAETLSFALLFEGRRRVRDTERTLARIAAVRLVRHLELCGFVLMKGPPAVGATATAMPDRRRE